MVNYETYTLDLADPEIAPGSMLFRGRRGRDLLAVAMSEEGKQGDGASGDPAT